MKPHGVAYYDPVYGVWEGTFVDGVSDYAVQQCLEVAKEVAAPQELPENGSIVVVSLVVDQEATKKMSQKLKPKSVIDDIADNM